MPFPKKALSEFCEIYERNTGTNITLEEADRIARELYQLFEVLSNPSEYRSDGSNDIHGQS